MSEVLIVSASAARAADAGALVFEYMAATVAQTSGRPAPASVDDLPTVLKEECRDLAGVYRDPGTLLVAYAGDGKAVGVVGLAWRGERTAEVKRLYVRPAHRGRGIARALMARAHSHAAAHGITSLILDVMPSRTEVIAFYERLGYAGTEPFPTAAPMPMVYMRRPVGPADIPIS